MVQCWVVFYNGNPANGVMLSLTILIAEINYQINLFSGLN